MGVFVTGRLEKAFGYQGDNLRLPVRDLEAALPFYEAVLGFRVVSKGDSPLRAATLARDRVEIGLVENGGDASQDGCAFHVSGIDSLFEEFGAKGLSKQIATIDLEDDGEEKWRVFYVIAPDGLCYWFGERQPS
jgi:catechol 2,3-dioxygenase-like lactoylglutathione lyase family enzyme